MRDTWPGNDEDAVRVVDDMVHGMAPSVAFDEDDFVLLKHISKHVPKAFANHPQSPSQLSWGPVGLGISVAPMGFGGVAGGRPSGLDVFAGSNTTDQTSPIP